MKTIIKPFILSIVIVGFIFLLINCKKNTDCIAVITVKKQSDTTLVVPSAKVTIRKGDVSVTGYTDGTGQFRHTYKLEAIFDVYASVSKKDSVNVDSLSGQAVIRLKPGETAYKTVFIQ
jgi:hypothetical protein